MAPTRTAPPPEPAAPSAWPAGVVGPEGAGLLPWLGPDLERVVAAGEASHAVLIHGPAGVGQFEAAVAAAQAALCEAPEPAGSATPRALACGGCAGCRLVQARAHPDLLVLLPEALREPLGWAGGPGGTAAEEGASVSDAGAPSARRKPSRELRVDDIRQAVLFAQTTPSRGRGKRIVVHPAERMNAIAANGLLKTLEEPSASLRLILATGDAARLLPTIRSRCVGVELPLPPAAQAREWLSAQGLGDAAGVLLQAAGGQPLDARALRADGIDAADWLALPRRVARGEAAALQAWPLPRLLEAMTALCVDLQRVRLGAAPRRWPLEALPPPPALEALNGWGRRLLESARHAEHPWNLPLAVDALVAQAATALAPERRHRAGAGG